MTTPPYLPIYHPPAPVPRPPVRALISAVLSGKRDLLSLLPDVAYRDMITPLGLSRRSILIVNQPEQVAEILVNAGGFYPKNDLMVGALEGLVGNSIFVSDGPAWKRQRRMIEPAFSHMRINQAFHEMIEAVGACEARWSESAAKGEAISLDAAMSYLTADIICRTIFSTKLDAGVSRDVFHAFITFERHVANVDLARLILGRPFAKVPQPPESVAACRTIRSHLATMLADWRARGHGQQNDICGAIVSARDPETGEPFAHEELIDQIGVFFLAGHETTASVLTWAFFILSQQPEIVVSMRAEIEAVTGGGAISFEHTKKLGFVRNVFRETMRLYPPITFIPRVAAEAMTIATKRVKRGTMVMIAPWTIHRHTKLWPNPACFDPDRFSPEREREIPTGAYIPFGLGPRICVGAAFATVESTLILARLIRAFDIKALDPAKVQPVARLTTRPAREIMCRLEPVQR